MVANARRQALVVIVTVAAVWLGGCGRHSAPTVDPEAYPEALDLTSGHLPVLARARTQHLDLGTPEARNYLLEGCSRDEVLADGTTFVWAVGSTSTLRFEVVEPSNLIFRARVWPYKEPNQPKQEIHFELNGETVGRRRLRPGLRHFEIKLPAAAQVAGMKHAIPSELTSERYVRMEMGGLEL